MSKRILQVTAGGTLGLFVALLLGGPGSGGDRPRPGEQFLLPVPLPAPDAELIDHTGGTVRLSELAEAHTTVLFFGYASCPDVCPITMAALSRARELLGAERERVTGVLITVDPDRDTPERLASFLGHFPPGLMGLTGSREALAEAARGYGVTVNAAPDGLIDHTGRAYVVHDGAVRMTFPPLTDPAQIAAGLKVLLDP